MRVLTADESRAVEHRAVVERKLSLGGLMRAAGAALAAEVNARVPSGDVVVVCGPGNNGGDGWVAARELAAAGRRVRVLALRAPDELSGVAAEAAAETARAGVRWTTFDDLDRPALDALNGTAVVVDALLGTGSVIPLREPLGSWCEAVNASGAYVVSADVPTGVDADTGCVDPSAIQADCTVTFTVPKRGLVLYPGAGCAGELVVADIGIDAALADVEGAPEVWSPADYADLVALPRLDAHKNERGRVLVVAGSRRFAGAAVLCARGAMRAGAGYVTLAVPEPVVEVAQGHLLAAPVVGLPAGRAGAFSSAASRIVLDMARDYDAVVIGPGLTLADGAVATARSVVASLDRPLVIDADGLNALVDARDLVERRTAPTVLTPHPGELARLLGITTAEVQADRVSSSARLGAANVAVVLKGAGTITSDGERSVVNTTGTPALATAGTGDVLAGVVGALLATGLGPLRAGAFAAWLHGRAGEAAASVLTPVSVIADDVPEYLPAVYAELLEDW